VAEQATGDAPAKGHGNKTKTFLIIFIEKYYIPQEKPK
jgi:hypothetical protein